MRGSFAAARPGWRVLLLWRAGARVAAAQAPPVRFGQPMEADFEARNFVADSGAAAVGLGDYGSSRFTSRAGEMTVAHEQLVRLKILQYLTSTPLPC